MNVVEGKLKYLVTLLVVLALITAACGGGETTEAPAQQDGAAEVPAASEEQAPAAEESAAEAPASSEEGASVETSGASLPSADFLTRDYEGTTLRVFFGPAGDEAGTYGDLVAQFEAETGITVDVVTAPNSATDHLVQMLQFLGAQSSDIDVYQVDVIWPGILANDAVDLSQYIPAEEVDGHFPAIIENNTVDGKLVAIPWFTDAGLLYYRTDLLEKYGYDGPPATWDELEEMAATIQAGEREEGNDSFWGFVWQGNNYEGLTCDALEWQYSHGGGRIIEPDGTITVNNENAIAAMNRAAGWVDTISPPGVTSYQEEDARGVWQSGNAAFMRNWPYAYSLGNNDDSPIQGLFDVSVLPTAADQNAGTLGGWNLMISQYSQNVDASAMFVRYLAGPIAQKDRVIRVSLLPTIVELYTDPEILEAQPFLDPLLDVFTSAVARPSTVTGELYNEISTAYFNAVHSVLTGEETGEDAMLDLEDELVDITGFEVGQP